MRIALHDELASGGIATVYLGSALDEATGARSVVAVKRLKDGTSDPELVTMLFDEARCAKRIRHPNVVSIIDVVADPSGVMLVLQYVHGETLARLFRACVAKAGRLPAEIAVAIAIGILEGLEAAHEATDVDGTPLRIVHRDVSPQNVMIGDDGVPRLLDFGIAKAAGRLRTTRDGSVRGKLGYLAPEQLGAGASRRSDVFSAAVVLWELLTGRRLYPLMDPHAFLEALRSPPPPPSSAAPAIPPELDRIVLRGLARDVDDRYPTAKAMAADLVATVRFADRRSLAAFVEEHAGIELERRRTLVRAALDGRAPTVECTRGTPNGEELEATERISADSHAAHRDENAVATPPARATATKSFRRHGAIAIGASLLVGSLVAWVRNAPSPTDAPASGAAAVAPASAAPTQEASVPTDAELAAETSTVEAGARVVPSAGPHTRSAPARRAERSATPDCDPPYTLSEDGARKIPKRECFR